MSDSIAQTDSSGYLFKGGLEETNGIQPETVVMQNISVASVFETNVFEAPGAVSIITEEDIKAGGYRDVIDLLNQIPGFSLAEDIQNGISFGIRGNWAEEAKLLIMLDGMPLNELSYGTYVLGQRISLVSIKRIEVIRGVGSSKYGGVGGLGVINIITKTGREQSGNHRLLNTTGYSNGAISRKNLSYNYGGVLPNGVEITTMGSINEGNMCNENVVLPDSSKVSLKDSSSIIGAQLMLSIKYKKFKFKQYYEDYNFQATFEPIFSQNRTSITEVEKLFEFQKTDVNFLVSYKPQIPWNAQYGDPKTYDPQNLLTSRSLGGITIKTKFAKPFQLLIGANTYYDYVKHHRSQLLLVNGKKSMDFMGSSAFIEAIFNHPLVSLNIGGRGERYAYFKPTFAPRLSIAKKFRSWHYKAIYNYAYKLPTMQNMNLDVEGSIKPESLTEIQLQTGLEIKEVNLIATYFNTSIKDLIVFGYNQKAATESYLNSGKVHSEGMELELNYANRLFKLSGSYSFNRLITSTAPEVLCDSTGGKMEPLGLPGHKAVGKLSVRVNSKMAVNMQYVYESAKESYVRVNRTNNTYARMRFGATHNINLVLNCDDIYKDIADISIGVFNLLDTGLSYLYTLNAGYPPLCGMGRELVLNLKFKF